MMRNIDVIAPNFKRRFSGVTSTILRLVPVQARDIDIVATGPGLPDHLPHVSVWRLLFLPRDRWRVWHARRNTEMLGGLILRYIFRRRLRLLFTSAAQRRHSGYTRWLIRRMDAVVATSTRAAAFLERDAQVIMHGVDAESFAPATDRTAIRAQLGLPDGVLIGCYGRVRHQKGVDLFIETLLRVLPDHADAHGIVMGRTTEQHAGFTAALKARVSEAGLSRRVHFLDEKPLEELADRFRALDIYVAPQRWEGFGLTPLEAMSSGVPVVATRVGAFEDLIADGETGNLVEIEDVDAMAAALHDLLADPAKRATWAQAARARVLAGFRIEDEAATLIALYRRLLAAA